MRSTYLRLGSYEFRVQKRPLNFNRCKIEDTAVPTARDVLRFPNSNTPIYMT